MSACSRAGWFSVMLALASIVEAGPVLHLSRSTVDFGWVAVGYPDVQRLFVTNTGDAPLTLSGLTLSGPRAQQHQVGGTCQIGVPIAPDARCRIDLQVLIPFPTFGSATHYATLTIASDGAPPSVDVSLASTEYGERFDPRNPVFTPDWLDFSPQAVGTAAAPMSLTIRNESPTTMDIRSTGLAGADNTDFTLIAGCTGSQLRRGESCTATIGFLPTATGPRSVVLFMEVYNSAYAVRSITGVGIPAGAPVLVDVVEYYNAVLDHYFVTWIAAEQADLDAGRTPTRWTRTGGSFRAHAAAQAGTSPVCRYYIPPEKGDSHFFGRGTVECNATGANNPTFFLEDPQFMHVVLPTAGVCPAPTVPIYRVFSNRPDANHRYMTDRAIRDQMVAKGWLAEGDGPDRVVMCGAT